MVYQYLNNMGWIRIRMNTELRKFKAGSGSGINHSGSATLVVNINTHDRQPGSASVLLSRLANKVPVLAVMRMQCLKNRDCFCHGGYE